MGPAVLVVVLLLAVGVDSRLQPVLSQVELLSQGSAAVAHAPAAAARLGEVPVVGETLVLLLGDVGPVLLAHRLGVGEVGEGQCRGRRLQRRLLVLVGVQQWLDCKVVAGRGRRRVPGEGDVPIGGLCRRSSGHSVRVGGLIAGGRLGALGAQDVTDGADAQVQHLPEVEGQAEQGHSVHDEQEDGLLRGPRHKAVHRVRAGWA